MEFWKNFEHFLVALCFVLIFAVSEAAECQSQTVSFTTNFTSFVITSNATDLDAKTCKYQFIVPKYFVPRLVFPQIHLTGDNKITLSQYSQYGGFKSYQVTEVSQYELGPVNFTLEIALPNKTPDDTFIITVSVKDATPSVTGRSFMVKSDLGLIIDSDSVPGSSSTVQMFDAQHPQSEFQIGVAMFTDGSLLFSLMQNIHVYDVDVYKGSLLDVWVAQNRSQSCAGTQFTLVNTNIGSVGIYSILIMPKNDWTGQINLQPAKFGNSSQSYTATNGATVFYEITHPVGGYKSPSILSQFSFRGDGTLQIFAGCLPGAQETRRIATVTPANADFYDQMMVFGRCKTYVLSQGVVQWNKYDNYYQTNYTHKIGRQGVIMSNTFPYDNDDTVQQNYLIWPPHKNEDIIVTYEVAYIEGNAIFEIEQDISAGKSVVKSLTAADTTFTSQVTYQQMSKFTTPKGSAGVLVRYTVARSAPACFGWMIVVLNFLIFLNLN